MQDDKNFRRKSGKRGDLTTIRVRIILILFLILSVYGKSQTFNFKQVTTKSVCLEQLMNKIVEVNNHFRDCAKHHYIVCEQSGDITQLQIESFDDEGIYPKITIDVIDEESEELGD